jgi:hypothetical protein
MSEFDVGGSVPADGNWFSFSKVRETHVVGSPVRRGISGPQV